jgi:hypothetical protein
VRRGWQSSCRSARDLACGIVAVCNAIEAYLGGLVLEEGDGDVAEGGVEDYALSVVGVAASLGTGGPGGRLRGGAGRGRALLVLAEH